MKDSQVDLLSEIIRNVIQVSENLKPAIDSNAASSSNDDLSDMLNDSNIKIKDRVTM